MKLGLTVVVTVAVLAAVALSRGQRQFSAEQHEQFGAALWRIKQLDAEFRENVLRARFALLNTYDDLEEIRAAESAALDRARQPPMFMNAQARGAIIEAVDAHRSLVERRAVLVERFKSQNAIVANSRRYLPLAVRQFDERIGSADTQAGALVHALVRDVLQAQAGDAQSARAALTQSDRVEGWLRDRNGDPLGELIASVVAHARAYVTGNQRLDALVAEILALPTADAAETISRSYEMQVADALALGKRYQSMLYAAAALMLIGLISTLWLQHRANRRLEQHVAERTEELAGSELRFRTLATAAPIGIFLTDAAGNGLFTNPHWQQITGLDAEQALGSGWSSGVHPDDGAVAADWSRAAAAGASFEREFRFVRPDGSVRLVHACTAVVRDGGGALTGHVGTVQDITEGKRLAAELQQAQKLESVGRLAAGVAHEINTPVQFVNDSQHFLRDGVRDLQSLVHAHRQTLTALVQGAIDGPSALAQMQQDEQRADLAYLEENIPTAVESSLEGLQRVATIVRSMKEFAHPDQSEAVAADLNAAILSTLTIARNEYKYVAELETELAELPPVPCFVGDFNQALLNIVVNAAHAIEDAVRDSDRRGVIRVATALAGDCVRITVADSGCGIPDHIRDKIFDPFFTTKAVGKGTGQGLAMARSVIVDKHGGRLAVDSRPGEGTTFTMELPLQRHALEAAA